MTGANISPLLNLFDVFLGFSPILLVVILIVNFGEQNSHEAVRSSYSITFGPTPSSSRRDLKRTKKSSRSRELSHVRI